MPEIECIESKMYFTAMKDNAEYKAWNGMFIGLSSSSSENKSAFQKLLKVKWLCVAAGTWTIPYHLFLQTLYE